MASMLDVLKSSDTRVGVPATGAKSMLDVLKSETPSPPPKPTVESAGPPIDVLDKPPMVMIAPGIAIDLRPKEEPLPKQPVTISQGGPIRDERDRLGAANLSMNVFENYYGKVKDSYTRELLGSIARVGAGQAGTSPDLMEAMTAGFNQSLMGRRGVAKGYKQDIQLTPEQYSNMSEPTKFMYSLASFAGDLPGFLFGGAVGATIGGPVGAFGGAFGFTEGLRSYYDQLIEKGEVKGPKDFFEVIKNLAIEELKGIGVGKTTEVAGALGKATGIPLGRIAAEAVALVTVPAALEQRLPTVEDYYDAASFLLGLNMITRGPNAIAKMREIYRKTGRTPKELKEDVKTDPELAQTLTDESTEVPKDVIDRAAKKVKDAEQVQADLLAKAAAAKAKEKPEEVVKEELKVKGKRVKKIKEEPPVELPEEKPAVKGKKGKKVEPEKVTEPEKAPAEGKKKVILRKGGKKEEKKKEVPATEPITDLDEQTGRKRPKALKPTEHPFRDKDPEHTKQMKNLLGQAMKSGVGPETVTRYLINEMNRYLNGEEVDVKKVRDALSTAAMQAEAYGHLFERAADHKVWIDTVREAAKWARESDRLTNKRTGKGDVRLNMMIPLDQIPKEVKEVLKSLKTVATKTKEYTVLRAPQVGDLYRNREIFDKTGFWLGKDGKWRYEIDDSKLRHYLPKEHRDYFDKEGFVSIPLTELVSYPELYGAVPELKDLFVSYIKGLPTEGSYVSDTKTISIRRMGDKDSLIHELQHAVNDIVGSRFRGSSVELENNRLNSIFFRELARKIKDPSLKRDIEKYRLQSRAGEKSISSIVDSLITSAKINKSDISTISEALRKRLEGNAFVNYLKDPGEMESRLSSARMDMTLEQRKATLPWETLDKMLDAEGLVEARGAAGTKLYSGIPIDEAPKVITKMFKGLSEFKKEFDASKKLKDFDLLYATKQLQKDVDRAFSDQSESLLKQVRANYPEYSQAIISRQRAAAAGRGYGRVVYEQMIREVFNGKTNAQVDFINLYILARRFKDIYSYVPETKYKHQPGYGANQAVSTVAAIELFKDAPDNIWKAMEKKVPEIKSIIGKLTPEEVRESIRAGDAFFEWSRNMVDDLVESGIKSKEEGEALKAHDFRKFRSVTVERLYDLDYNISLKGESIRMTNSGVEPLGHGSTKILDYDARSSASEMAGRVYGSIANQAAKLEWKELAEARPDNPYVSVKRKPGWSPMPYYDKGVRKNIYFNPAVVKYLITKSHDISPRLATVIRTATIAPVTRSLAVGTSPAWSTFIGLPMDVLHSLFTARTYQLEGSHIQLKSSYPFFETVEGKFKPIYSPFMPLASLQLGKDMAETIHDVYTRGPLFMKYAKYGGMMPFLSAREGRYTRGVRPPGDFEKLMDIVSYHGNSMELWVRIANANRLIKRAASERGISYEEAVNNKDILYEAVHTGRDRMDYNQGGWFIKAMDQNGFIFLNAAILGTRTFWRSAVDNPVDFTVRAAQLMGLAAGITAMSWTMYPDVMKEVPTEGNEKNIVFPLFPSFINFKDKEGNTRYYYAKLRMDPGPAFMYKLADNLTRTYLYDRGMLDTEPNYHKVVDSLKQLGPVGLSLPPSIQFGVDYATNYSWWADRKIYTDLGGRTFSWPNSQYEGIDDPNVSQLAKDISSITKMSPVRLQRAMSNIIPTNNEFAYMFGKGYEEMFSDVPEEVRSKHWLQTLAERPGVKSVIGVTSPGYDRRQTRDVIDEEVTLEKTIAKEKFRSLATNHLWYGVGKRDDVIDYMAKQDYEDYKNMRDEFKFIEKTKDLKHRSLWLSMWHMSPEVKAREYSTTFDRSSPAKKIELEKELDQVISIGGYITDRVRKEFMEIRKSK